MCLITKQKKPIKIRKDRTVYKILEMIDGDMYSAYHGMHRYVKGRLYCQEMNANNISYNVFDSIASEAYPNWRTKNYTHVHQGLHAVKYRGRIRGEMFENEYIVEFLIPKGSLIYEDKTGLIVSNQIIMEKIL